MELLQFHTRCSCYKDNIYKDNIYKDKIYKNKKNHYQGKSRFM